MIYRSPYPDIDIPVVPVTHHVLRHASALADKPALIEAASGRTLTYATLAEQIGRCAGGLRERGFGRGDVMAILLPNLPEFAVVFHAVASLGGVATTVNPLYTAGELASQLADAGASRIVTVGAFLDTAREAAQTAGLDEIITLDGAPETVPYASLLQCDPVPVLDDIDPTHDLVALPYSSGTTGRAKGVMITHHNMVANMCQIEGAIDPDERVLDDVLLAVLPFFHIYGLTIVLNYNLSMGNTVVTQSRFEMEAFLRALQDYRVTVAQLVPPIVLGLAKHPLVDQMDLSALRHVWCGAAPLGKEVGEAAAGRVGSTLAQGFGMTEVSGCALLPRRGGDGHYDMETCGSPPPHTEAKVVDVATGEELDTGQEGELCVRGPQVMQGYLNRPEETAQALDADGWLRTGDIVRADDEGRFVVVDRVKELIKYKAMQVAPAELEALLLGHDHITDAAVIGRPDEEAGEIPFAFVVASEPIESDAVMAYVAERVAPHKRIRGVSFVDAIPKAPSGKILRRVLKEGLSASSG